jgi:hypothetical protein
VETPSLVTVGTVASRGNPLQKKDVFVALPWYKSSNPLTAFSVMGLIDRRRTAITLNFGDAFVVHSRNTLADAFLRTDMEWMLTVDDDMVVPFGNGDWFNLFTGMNLPEPFRSFNALDRLLSHGKTLIGALYFGRWRGGSAIFAEAFTDKTVCESLRKKPIDAVRPTKWVGTGCMLIHRSVYLDIEKKFPHLARNREGGTRGGNWFTSSEHDLKSGVDRILDELDQSMGRWSMETLHRVHQQLTQARALAKHNSGLGVGEDVIFSARAAAAGHQPFVDLGLICGHVGHETYTPFNTK